MPPEGQIRVLVVDDHPVVREGLKAVLAADPDTHCIGSVSTGLDAVSVAARERPDVVIMDLRLPDLDGVEATRRILAENQDVAVLVLTMHDDDESLFSAVRAGARGYLLKGATHADISRAVHAVVRGEAVFGSEVAQRLLDSIHGTVRPPLPELSEREREVLALLVAGHGTHEIARRLYLSPKTVRNHVSHVLGKLDAPDRAQAIARARAAGLVEP